MNAFLLKENYYALVLSILKGWTPEQSFLYFETGEIMRLSSIRKDITNDDVMDMVALRDQGLTYKEIGDLYNAKKDMIVKRIDRYMTNKKKAVGG